MNGLRANKPLGCGVQLIEFFQIDIEVKVHLDWLMRTAPITKAVHIVLQLPTLSQYLVPSIGGGYFHERSRCVPIIPFHNQLSVLANAGGIVLTHASALLSLTCSKPMARPMRSAHCLTAMP